MKNSRIKALLFCVFVVSTAVILANRLTALYINNSFVHFLFFFLSVGSLSIMAIDYLFDKRTTKSVLITLIIVGVLSFVKAFLTWGGDWKTQTIIYREHYHPAHTIESQLRGDRFSFGYRKRIVDRQRIVPFFDITKVVDTSAIDSKKWDRVDEQINEIKLSGK